MFNRLHDFRSAPRAELEVRVAGSTPSHVIYLEPVLPIEAEESKSMSTLTLDELKEVCDQIMESIISQLKCMPPSVRYLLKIVEQQAELNVISRA